ncbi:MAG: amino acid racemase [Burkholderiales bacterium]
MRVGENVVGVIGGMGPAATVEFMRRLVAATPAPDDMDHLHVLVDNNPKVPSRIAALIEGTGADPAPALCEMAKGLEAQGADFLVIPCNTAHYYLPTIARSVHIPVLDMIGLSVQKLAAVDPKPRRIGLLASPAVRLVGLYQKRIEEMGLHAIFPSPDFESRLLEVIKAVKSGQLGTRHQQDYAAVAKNLMEAGADAFLIACTDLSVIGPPLEAACPVVDSLDVLVEATIVTAHGARPLSSIA